MLHKETHRYQFGNGELMELFLFIYLVYLTRGGSQLSRSSFYYRVSSFFMPSSRPSTVRGNMGKTRAMVS